MTLVYYVLGSKDFGVFTEAQIRQAFCTNHGYTFGGVRWMKRSENQELGS